MNTEKCNALVERDHRVIAPAQHLSYFPLAVAKVDQDIVLMKMGINLLTS